ncbi:hypothetical protein UFOVP1296_79 [uncultured Caudovirales phage]|uniref:Uncharacterized protein n=1 Tax=uncultured Caudovirales phage TaxID=2100421 RepID=A0A6J5RS06_9CAUD|nr:hypothetical protein UFOVP471_14 [uncultured Caudovirales phage]CAB4169662.1 hypothetical protein UFOVP890_79 [uncultured Caudovirales phage]CAB4196361.1 hypothetical protein UFOVP1296_79 [uncultured Caudovirales phage]
MPTINLVAQEALKQASELYAEHKNSIVLEGMFAYKIYLAQGGENGQRTLHSCFVEANQIMEQYKNQHTVLISILATLIVKADQLEGKYA